MKTLIIAVIYFFICLLPIQSQTLYGTTFRGGPDGGGAINKFIPGTNELVVVHPFETGPRNPEYTQFIQASDGKLYGLTSQGGSHDVGVILSFDLSTSAYTKLQNFNITNGATPQGNLIQASNGKLYGMTSAGGSHLYGVMFSFDPSTSIYTKLLDFDGTNGTSPNGGFIELSDGKLYGMARGGGSNGAGVIFSFDPLTSTYTKLKDFNTIAGADPQGNLVQATDGKLYGRTAAGGTNGGGVIFSFDPSTSVLAKLTDFVSTRGPYPAGSLVQASDGKLYGMNHAGGSRDAGVIFSFDLSTSTYLTLKDFDHIDGAFPFGSLVQATDGKLYGMTSWGGGTGGGIIFSLEPSTSAFTRLREFDPASGHLPHGSLMQASDGKLYGMTNGGGVGRGGVIFSFDPAFSAYTKLADFGINVNGTYASEKVVQADNGKLYGMTHQGGSYNYGVIFSFDPSSSTYTKLKDFDQTNGANPFGSLVQASNGKLYGMTASGGSHGAGVIFSFDPVSSTYTKLKSFEEVDGASPNGSLVEASDGKLYGMTPVGGSIPFSSSGVIFSLDPSTSIYTRLRDFNYTLEGSPGGTFIQANDGKLYGTTNMTIFSFDPSASTYTTLKTFDYTTGDGIPRGTLVQASDGRLYGVTKREGNGFGTIYSFDISSSTYTKLRDFDDTDGPNPYYSLMLASDGKLYGATSPRAPKTSGVIFSFNPASSTYTKLRDYRVSEPSIVGDGAFIEAAPSGPLPVTLLTFTAFAARNGKTVQVEWSTAAEINNDYFDVERSSDGEQFASVGKQKGCTACTGTQHYAFIDKDPLSGLSHYRLKQVDRDGTFSYSAIALVTISISPRAGLQVYPSITDGTCALLVNNAGPGKQVSLQLHTAGGSLVKQQTVWLKEGDNKIGYTLYDQSAGVYYITVLDKTANAATTVMVIKN